MLAYIRVLYVVKQSGIAGKEDRGRVYVYELNIKNTALRYLPLGLSTSPRTSSTFIKAVVVVQVLIVGRLAKLEYAGTSVSST